MHKETGIHAYWEEQALKLAVIDPLLYRACAYMYKHHMVNSFSPMDGTKTGRAWKLLGLPIEDYTFNNRSQLCMAIRRIAKKTGQPVRRLTMVEHAELRLKYEQGGTNATV